MLSIKMVMAEEESARRDTCNNRIPTPEPQKSSPPRPLDNHNSDKPKRKPTVTPRTFTRFFTPRSSLERGRKIGTSRRILRDITASGSNRKDVSRRRTQGDSKIQILKTDDDVDDNNDDDEFAHNSKNRKRYRPISPDTTPDLSSPLKRMRSQSLELLEDNDTDEATSDTDDGVFDEYSEGQSQNGRPTCNPIKSRYFGSSGMAFSRQLGEIHRTRGLRYPFNGNERLQSFLSRGG